MWDIVYYLAGVSVVGSMGYCILYICDIDSAKYIAQKASWNAVKTYHKTNLEIKNLKDWLFQKSSTNEFGKENIELEELTKNKIEFIGYKESDDTIYTSSILENNIYIQDTDFDLMFLKKKENNIDLYKRINEKTEVDKNIKMEKIDKQFIQIELCQNSTKTSIHKNLEGFYLTDNTLLDYMFLKWYVNKFYGLLLTDTYKLSVIDSDINMFNLEKNQSITINRKKNYDVKTSKK
jgi:hypothetical protein|tara:strand:+ start:1183 stop:1887 length:705 start_codon:yes stop_codon:yes gene_type:complete